MKALDLSEAFFEEMKNGELKNILAQAEEGVCVGMTGEGSECFGWDDNISQDHDWGIGLQFWLSDLDYRKIGKELQKWYEELPNAYKGYPIKKQTVQKEWRVGVWRIADYFYHYIGNEGIPQKPIQWLYVEEWAYACVTNGRIFHKGNEKFMEIREVLQKGYPDDVRCKKIAARAVRMAQTGQYNYVRCMKRGERGAAFSALAEFMKETISMVHLLNHTYTPFYKWMWRSMKMQKLLVEISGFLELLYEEPFCAKNSEIIEKICILVKDELLRQNLTDVKDNFLESHGVSISQRIQDKELKKLPVIYG